MLFDYDDRDQNSIFNYAKKLEGMTFQDILNEYNKSFQKHYVNTYENGYEIADTGIQYDLPISHMSTNAKGQLGNFLEKYYFGYKPNSVQGADFPKAGIELKQTCVDLNKNGSYTAGERLSITNISYKEPVEDDFYKSHVWSKIKLILLVQYLRNKSLDRMQYTIMFVNLFSPSKEDLKIIIEDYTFIVNKIKSGNADVLRENDTLYLGACTKGESAEKSWVPQYYGEHALAKKRNFCFRKRYMNCILNAYILKRETLNESIIKNNKLTSINSFENQIISLINRYTGKSDEELCGIFGRKYNNNKAQWSDLTYRMLGIKGNKAEEFVKANIVVKAIRIEEDGSIIESMSFPTIKFKEFAKQEFEDSDFCNYFEETKFLFVVYKSDGKQYILKGAQLWNMPYEDLYGDAKVGWEEIRNKIKDGVSFTIENGIVRNDLPKKSDNRILHIRPHAQRSACKLKNGFEKGNIKRDADELPNGEWMTTQSLWLNNTYILSQLKVGMD